MEAEPQNKSLRLNPTEEDRYAQVARQMEGIVSSKYRIDVRADNNPTSFWGLEKQPAEHSSTLSRFIMSDSYG